VFHDVEPFGGTRLVDGIRRSIQIITMKRAIALATCSIFTVPLEKISWLASKPKNSHFIPVGPNFPILTSPDHRREERKIPTIAVFGITGGDAGITETRTIITAVRYAAQTMDNIRLLVFGRNADSAEIIFRKGLDGLNVELSVEGLLEESALVEKLSISDVLLFVRGPISSRRGSAIAGIACGLPVIAYVGSETAAPITDAGVVLVSLGNQEELNAALVRVLSDPTYRGELAAKSRVAFIQNFSWPAIALRYAAFLKE
jgi:glycosyltransferase involved in cell wall biosynthesis